jgi:hypothetical protein
VRGAAEVVSAAPDRLRLYIDPDTRGLFINVFQDNELVAQVDLDTEDAIDFAVELLVYARGVKQRPPRPEHQPHLEIVQ